MATSTVKLGISKPDPLENVDVLDDLGVQFDKLDTAIGVTWVADGASPGLIYHGLQIKELTSLREFIYKNDGVGGFLKIETGNAQVGTVNHYTKTPAGIVGDPMTAVANNWATISGGSVTWTSDRPALAYIRVNCDVTPHAGANSVKFRLTGQANSETPSIFPPGGRQAVQINQVRHIAAGTFSLNTDFYNFTASGQSILQALTYYVDTVAVLT